MTATAPALFLDPKSPLVLATHNQGKVVEIAELLAPYGFSVRSAAQCNAPEPEETGATFIENALLKARACAAFTSLPSLADDSGLSVVALNGEPGIYSARWAGAQKDFGLAMDKVLKALPENADRAAYFTCVLALAWPDGKSCYFEGIAHGHLAAQPVGDKGFGYDPIFIPTGYQQSYAQLEPALKNAISHRAQAWGQLERALLQPLKP